jgi:hypothetical protein
MSTGTKKFSLREYGFNNAEVCTLSDGFKEGYFNCGCGYQGTTWWHTVAELTKDNQDYVYDIVGCPHCEQLKFIIVD